MMFHSQQLPYNSRHSPPSCHFNYPGAMAPEHVQTNIEWFKHPIPEELWRELKERATYSRGRPNTLISVIISNLHFVKNYRAVSFIF